jgi:hypothetical protein
MIQSAIGMPKSFIPTVEDPLTVQVERGMIYPLILGGGLAHNLDPIDRLIDLSNNSCLEQITVVDVAGHRRPVYRPLLIYCWLVAMKLSPRDQWKDAIYRWCDVLGDSLLNAAPTSCDAINGAEITKLAWEALAMQLAAGLFIEPMWTIASANAFATICQAQQRDGAFLKTSSSDNPETHWYHELVILHAMTSFAVHSRNDIAMQSAARNAEFHLRQTQPDHATSQPWGLLAFVLHAPLLADQVLHTITTQHPGGVDGVSLLLLADALYGLRQLKWKSE